MEKTAMAQLIDWMNTPAKSLNDGKSVIQKANELLIVEKEQMCKMYVTGRNDNHLDYYPEKHAKETYDEFFVRGQQNEC